MISSYLSKIGPLKIETEGNELTALSISECREDTVLNSEVKEWLDNYFKGKDPGNFPLKLKDTGSEFEKKVRKILLKVPFGKTVTYGKLAKMISLTMSSQAIGQALNKNPFLIVVPCHRVIDSKGGLRGFAYGSDKKRLLLENEGHRITKKGTAGNQFLLAETDIEE